jgi:hypothetical protein
MVVKMKPKTAKKILEKTAPEEIKITKTEHKRPTFIN